MAPSEAKPTDGYGQDHEDYMGAYMFGYGVFSNENNEKQNFGQKEHRNEDEVNIFQKK
jgi:hypothetical protein